MKTNLELVIMIIYTAHALPIRNTAQRFKKDSADDSPKFHTLSEGSIKQIRKNFLDDPSSEIKKLNITGRSRRKDSSKVMTLSDAQIKQLKDNYENSLTDTEIIIFKKESPLHDGVSGRSRNHNESSSSIYIWSSNALTEEEWETIRNNIEENPEEKIKHIDDKHHVEKGDNHTSKHAEGRHRLLNESNVITEPKYYSFSHSEWEELKQTLHKHLIGEDEKILKVNEVPSGRHRSGEVESPPRWNFWSSYALKPSEWDQIKQNIQHNETILNTTQHSINIDGRGRSNTENNDHFVGHIDAKPVTGERLYNLRKNFDWDSLLDRISHKNTSTTIEGKVEISSLDNNVGHRNQTNDDDESLQIESQIGRSRTMGRKRVMPSLVLDDDDDESIQNFVDIGKEPIIIEKDITFGGGKNSSNSKENVNIPILEGDLNNQNTEKSILSTISNPPGSELEINVNTFTPSIYLSEGILDHDTTPLLQLNPKTTRENYIIKQTVESGESSTSRVNFDVEQSIESDHFASTTAYGISDTEMYGTESVQYDNTTRENYIIENLVLNDNSTNLEVDDTMSTEKSDATKSVDLATTSYETSDTDEYVTESADNENSTRENYIIKQSIVNDNSEKFDFTESLVSASTIADKTTDTGKYVTESVENEDSTRENYIIKHSLASDNLTSLNSLEITNTDKNYVTESSDTEMYTTESVENEKSTRENYIIEQSLVRYNSTSLESLETTNTEKSVTESSDTEMYVTESVENENSTRENYIIKQSLEITNTETSDVTESSDTEMYVTESVENENSTSENYMIKQSLEITNTEKSDVTESSETEMYVTESVENEKSTREHYIIEQSLVSDNSKSFESYDTTNTGEYGTTEAKVLQNSTREVYIKMKPDTDSTESMDSSTLTEDEDFNSNEKTTNETIILIDIESRESLTEQSLVTSAEITATEDKETIITESLIPENLNNTTNILLDISTISQSTESTTEGKGFGFFGFFGLLDESDSIMTTMNAIDDSPGNEILTTSVSYPDTTTDSGVPLMDEDGYVVIENRFDIPEDSLLSTTTEVLLVDNDSSLEDRDPAFNGSSTEVMMDEEIHILTTDSMSDTSEYFSTTSSEALGAVLLTSDSFSTSEENLLQVNDDTSDISTLNNLNGLGEITSDIMITTVDINVEENNGSTIQFDKDEENAFNPLSSAEVSERTSIGSSEVISTTLDIENNENMTTAKLLNESPNQPQELIGNEIPIISTTADPPAIEPSPAEPVSNMMPTWIILLIVLILALIVVAVGFIVVVRMKRQTGHVQLSP